MTTEDIKTMNDILQKYNITSWSLAYTQAGKPVLLPIELDASVKSEILVKEAPPVDMVDPKFNLNTNKWEENNTQSQAKMINDLQDQIKEIKNDSVDTTQTDTKIDQISQSITQLTQLVAQSMMPKAGASNE